MTATAVLFGDRPSRDSRFEVRELWREMANLPHDHPDVGLEFLLRQLNEELNAMEIAARNLVDFPDEDWGLRMALARQCSDEARHAVGKRKPQPQQAGPQPHCQRRDGGPHQRDAKASPVSKPRSRMRERCHYPCGR